MLAVQGPRSDEVLQALGLPTGHDYMSFVEADWQGRPVIVCRTGYTGERGYELVPRWDDAPALWDALTRRPRPYDGLPCGLGARDTLRTEMGYPLHGNDLSLDITPVQARAGWAVGWKKDGSGAGTRSWPRRRPAPARLSWGLLATGRGIPRAHCEVHGRHGEPVGRGHSGTFSPTLKQGIALALLAAGVAEGDEVVVDVRGRAVAATRGQAAVRAGADAARRARPLTRRVDPPARRLRRPAGGVRPAARARAQPACGRTSCGGREGDREPGLDHRPEDVTGDPADARTARRTTTEPATTAAARTTGPAHQRRPAREPAAAEKAAMATVPAIRAGAPTVPATVAPRPSERAGGTPRRHAQASSERLESTATPASAPPRHVPRSVVSAATSSSSTRVTAATPLGPMSLRRMTSSARSRSYPAESPSAVSASPSRCIARVPSTRTVTATAASTRRWRADQAADGGHGQDAEGER